MSEALPELTPKTFEALMGRLREDPSLRMEVIQGVGHKGFVAVLEQFFELSKKQKERLEPLRSARNWDQVITIALISGGNISIVHGGRESFDLELHAHFGPVDVDVEIHC